MAKNVEEVTLKVGVQGTESLDRLNDKLGNIDKSTKSAADKLQQFNVRNISYQIQDLAVQLSMGTSAFIALGQQLPQLLGGFGTAGAVIGAVAAVTIPLLQKGLEALGYDFRSLNQHLTDLETSTKKYQDAQRSTFSSMDILKGKYGTLSEEAQRFYKVQEQLSKQSVQFELATSIKEVSTNLDFMNMQLHKTAGFFAQILNLGENIKEGDFLYETRFSAQAKLLGLTAEQAKEVQKQIKGIDGAKPDEALKTINGILEYLSKTNDESTNLIKQQEKVVEPLMRANEQILKFKENIRASAEDATRLATELLGIQSQFQPDINAARRNFNQIGAIQLEGRQKVAEFEKQIAEKTKQDQVDRSKEVAAFRLRTEQDVNDKIKDFTKGQYETFRAASLTNDAKQRQLGLESEILKLQESGKLSALNAFQFNEELLRNAYNYNEALKAIDEQRRKNNITIDQQRQLEQQAAGVKERSDELAYQAMWKRQSDFIQTQEQVMATEERRLALFNKTLMMSDREKKNAETIFSINEDRIKQLKGLESINDPILRTVKEKELNAVFDQRIKQLEEIQQIEFDSQRQFQVGWTRAFNEYVDNATNAARQAGIIFNKLTSSLEDMLLGFFKTGKLGWKDFLNTIIDQLMRSQIQQLIAKTFGGVGAISGSSKGGLLGGAIIPGFLAQGGPAQGGRPYVVGENGPELFVPNQSGTVIPNNQMPNTSSIVYNINAVDALSFKQMIAADPSFLYAVTEQGRRRIPGAR